MQQDLFGLNNLIMRRITASDYIVEFLIKKGIKDVFGYQGGMIAYLFDSLKKYEGQINYHIPYHEQGGSFAANGNAQVSGKAGFCFVTSGPGFTNALTGMANAYCDSIPVIYIMGQVNFKDKKHGLQMRQKGFQEILAAEIAKPICKKSYDIETVDEIIPALNEAYDIAISGRKGPVFLDIPINVFREFVEFDDIKEDKQTDYTNKCDFTSISAFINSAEKPVILAGAGIKQAKLTTPFRELINKTNIPVVTSMLAVDLLEDGDCHKFGFIGPDGIRCANYIIDKSDCVISLGSRLEPRQTGYNVSLFAPEAKIIRVDIDESEFNRDINTNTININCSLSVFLSTCHISNNLKHKRWLQKCTQVKKMLDGIDVCIANEYINALSNLFIEDGKVFLDVGKNELWGAQSVIIKSNTEVFMSGGFGSMGYSLPASIGACFETKKPTYSINGDGGIQMNIQELQTIVKNNLPVKIIVINNHALANVAIFQNRWLGSRYVGTLESKGDYFAANICEIAKAYGIRSYKLDSLKNVQSCSTLLTDNKPVVIEFTIPELTPVLPDIGADKDPLRADQKIPSYLVDQIEQIMNC